jgi:hypothetical protein
MARRTPPPAGTWYLAPCADCSTSQSCFYLCLLMLFRCDTASRVRRSVLLLLETSPPLLAEHKVPPLPATQYRVMRLSELW